MFCTSDGVGTSGFVSSCPRTPLPSQRDRNLVLYVPGAERSGGLARGGNANSRLVVQNDGNVMIYRSDVRAIWVTNTVQPQPT